MSITLHHIYVLKDENGNVFYVGKTSTPERRYKRHLAHVRYGSHYPVHNKLRKVIRLKGTADGIYELIESNISPEKIDEREMFHIKSCKTRGCKLKNLTEGGEGGKGYTDEINKRAALKRVGQKRTTITCQRISNAKRGVKFSDKHKKALSKAWKERIPLTSEHYQKISEMNRGVVNIQTYLILSPTGEEYVTTSGITDFCRERGLTSSNLVRTQPGGNRLHHKGWRVLKKL